MKQVVRYGNSLVDVGFKVDKIRVLMKGEFFLDEAKRVEKLARRQFAPGSYSANYRTLSIELDRKTSTSTDRYYHVYFANKAISWKAPMDIWLQDLYEKALKVEVVA